ncbi:MAG: hypothetical protein PUF40_14440 [Blautia massiliensis]|nr:hypothetical protein [Blautia massiliensis (ex Durand et al. 2017)]
MSAANETQHKSFFNGATPRALKKFFEKALKAHPTGLGLVLISAEDVVK